jgi:hypothetical protein
MSKFIGTLETLKGDSLTFNLKVYEDEQESKLKNLTGFEAVLTVKKNAKDSEPLITQDSESIESPELGTITFKISYESNEIEAGEWLFDIQLTNATEGERKSFWGYYKVLSDVNS